LAKKLAKNTDFFVADPKLMPIVAKNLGSFWLQEEKLQDQ
jgi:ribosomal protein L1